MVTRWHSRYRGANGKESKRCCLEGVSVYLCVYVCACNGRKEFDPKCDGIDSEMVPHNEHSARKHIASEFLAADSSTLLG